MMRIDELPKSAERESPEEFARFREFIRSHCEKRTSFEDQTIGYCICGKGHHTILTFAGGWGGIEMLYETILGFESRNRMVVVDISNLHEAEKMVRGIDFVLDREGIDHVVLMGQSLSGILAQLYFRRRAPRVKALILTNTLAPKPQRCRKWVRIAFSCLPFRLFRLLVRRKIGGIAHFEAEIPPDMRQRRQFVQNLFTHALNRSFTRKRINDLLDLVWTFNRQGPYQQHEFGDWPGQILLISSPDDPNQEDATILKSSLPATRQTFLPSGYGHMAPQICRDQFHSIIQNFIDGI